MSTAPVREEPRAALRRHFLTSLETGTFVHLNLGHYCGSEAELRQSRLRRVELKAGPVLSEVRRFERRDVTVNHAPETAGAWFDARLAEGFRAGHLATTTGDWELSQPGADRFRLRALPASQTTAPAATHDQARQRLVDPRAPYLRELGVVRADGATAREMGPKLRQIEKFVEILEHWSRDTAWAEGGPKRLVDMGCGKAYLTFAAWDHFRRTRPGALRVTGVELRPDLVQANRAVAARLGATDLEFIEGTIAAAPLEQADIVVALHACDTATDEALARAVQAGARLILAAPCCHRELRRQLQCPENIQGLLDDGILEERQAELLTDRLRALQLQVCGYDARVFEFVSTEETHRNLMIAARLAPDLNRRRHAEETLRRLKASFGLASLALERLLQPATK